MNILITGGAGYIGTELAHRLTEREGISHVTIFDNLARKNHNIFLENRFNPDKISFIHGDILDGRRLSKALKKIDVVYHLAAKVTTPYADQELHKYEQVNHWGTTGLVQRIRESEVSRVVFLSSAAVYGLGEQPFDEQASTNPANHYGITKYRAEQEIRLLDQHTDINIIRSANVYGYSRSMRFDSVINRFMFDAHFTNRITVYGSGRQERPFISISYLAQLLTELLFDEDFPDLLNAVAFNRSLNEIIYEYLKPLYPDLEVLYVNQDMPVRSVNLGSNYDLTNYKDRQETDFGKELQEFKKKFSF